MNKHTEQLSAAAASQALIGNTAMVGEGMHAHGLYKATLRGYKASEAGRYLSLHAMAEKLRQRLTLTNERAARNELKFIEAELDSLCEDKAQLKAPNLVTTVGGNYLLDNGLAGSAYTAAFYMGLISLVTYTGVALGDTQAVHGGWVEAGGVNAPTYSGSRKTVGWAAAAGKSKALSVGLVFTFTGAGTVKGCFLSTVATVDGTLGTLYSAGLFTGGDQPVVATNTLTVTYTASV